MAKRQDAKELFESIVNDLDFQDIKDAYEQKRENERIKLRDYLKVHPALKEAKLEVARSSSGKGRTDYTSGGNIAPFDLSNWKWVEVKLAKAKKPDKDQDENQDRSFSAVISLNMFDTDPQSSNFHALYDRVGLVIEGKSGNTSLTSFVHTNIDLPLNEADMEKIAKLVIEQFKIFSKSAITSEGITSASHRLTRQLL